MVGALSIILLTFGILLVVFAIVFAAVRGMKTRGEAAVRDRYPDARLIIPNAVFFGQESKGLGQVRGNGTLAITEREVYFRKWLPATEYTIPLSSIQAVETPTSFLGKSYGRPLLKLVYRDENGQPDSIAWYVPQLEAVTKALRGI